MPIEFTRTVPTFRIFDVAKAKEFYVGWLGFKVDWEHQFEPNTPLYIQVSRGSLQLHLSEHHGDSTPGSVVFVEMKGIEEFHREIMAKNYKYNRPGLDQTPWNSRCVNVIDPFATGYGSTSSTLSASSSSWLFRDSCGIAALDGVPTQMLTTSMPCPFLQALKPLVILRGRFWPEEFRECLRSEVRGKI